MYRALHPAFDRATLIAGGGKRECISLRRALEPVLAEFAPALRVIALLDKDCAPLVEQGVELLSVSMIENFLLDPDVIYEAVESVRERTSFKTVEDVTTALDAILTEATVTVTFDSESTHSEEQQRSGWQAILDNFARHVGARRKA